MKKSISLTNTFAVFLAVSISILSSSVVAAQDEEPVIVNVDNFVRAETFYNISLAPDVSLTLDGQVLNPVIDGVDLHDSGRTPEYSILKQSLRLRDGKA